MCRALQGVALFKISPFTGIPVPPVGSTEPWASCGCLPKGIETGEAGIFGDRENMAGLCQRGPSSGELRLGLQARVPLGLLPRTLPGGDLGAPGACGAPISAPVLGDGALWRQLLFISPAAVFLHG